jgi:hypothetical protein
MELAKRSRQNAKFGFVAVAVLISLNLWSFQLIPENIYKVLEALLLGVLILVLFTSKEKIRQPLIFKENVILFMVIPVLSAISALIYHDQSLPLSMLILRTNFFWLLYFVLHRFDIPKQSAINLLVFVGLVWMIITIVQQFTYPTYYFYTRSESDDYSILRANVYRFMAYGHQYGGFVLFYFAYKYFQRRKVAYLLVVAISLTAFYYYGTRQFAIAGIICIPLAVLFLKGKSRMIAASLIIIGATLIFYYRDPLFQQYIEMTRNQYQGGEDVRQMGAKFWLFEYWPHWTTQIFGNGRPHINSAYGAEMERIRLTYHFYRSDVGIIGAFNEFGILYVLNVLWTTLKGLRSRYLLTFDKYLVLLFINSLVLLLTSLYYSNSMGIPFYCLLFYVFEKSYVEKRLLTKPRQADGKDLEVKRRRFGLSY